MHTSPCCVCVLVPAVCVLVPAVCVLVPAVPMADAAVCVVVPAVPMADAAVYTIRMPSSGMNRKQWVETTCKKLTVNQPTNDLPLCNLVTNS